MIQGLVQLCIGRKGSLGISDMLKNQGCDFGCQAICIDQGYKQCSKLILPFPTVRLDFPPVMRECDVMSKLMGQDNQEMILFKARVDGDPMWYGCVVGGFEIARAGIPVTDKPHLEVTFAKIWIEQEGGRTQAGITGLEQGLQSSRSIGVAPH